MRPTRNDTHRHTQRTETLTQQPLLPPNTRNTIIDHTSLNIYKTLSNCKRAPTIIYNIPQVFDSFEFLYCLRSTTRHRRRRRRRSIDDDCCTLWVIVALPVVVVAFVKPPRNAKQSSHDDIYTFIVIEVGVIYLLMWGLLVPSKHKTHTHSHKRNIHNSLCEFLM